MEVSFAILDFNNIRVNKVVYNFAIGSGLIIIMSFHLLKKY